MVHRMFAFGLLLLWQTVALAAQTERWPEFRGPTGQGHSAAQDVPLEWSESRNVLWKTPVQGRGWSSPDASSGGSAFVRAELAFSSAGTLEVEIDIAWFKAGNTIVGWQMDTGDSAVCRLEGTTVH